MLYTPGPKAKAEYRAFTKRGGPWCSKSKPLLRLQTRSLNPARLNVTSSLGGSRRRRPQSWSGITLRCTSGFSSSNSIGGKRRRPKKPADPAAFLVDAIRKGYAAPKGFESKAERTKRDEAKREQERREAEARRLKEETRRHEQEAHGQISAYLKALTGEEEAKLDAQAIEQAEPSIRASYERGEAR